MIATGVRFVLFTGAAFAFTQPADEATVKDDSTQVYGRPAAGSVEKTLARGEKVRVLYSVTKPDGTAWCEVKGGGANGYVLCRQLDWPGGERRANAVTPMSAEAAKPAQPVKAASAPTKLEHLKVSNNAHELTMQNFNPYYWAWRLEFTPEQWVRMDQLLRDSDVSSCSDSIRESLGKRGIKNIYEFGVAAGDGTLKRFESELLKEFDACGDRLIVFWRRFPEFFTPDQRRQLEADRRQVSKSAGFAESQVRLVFRAK